MRKIFIILALLILGPITQINVNAQTSSLRLSPSRTLLTARPGETVRTIITLENTTNKPMTVRVTARDFQAGPELSGEPKLLDSPNPNYGLSNWLTDSNLQKMISIPANQTIDYQATFIVPASAQVRSYFGSVIFTDDARAYSIGSLVFITIGDPETSLSITDLSFGESNDATKPNGIFTATVNNQGDGLSSPEFLLKISNNKGDAIETINLKDQGSILPKSSRKYQLTPTKKLPDELLTASLSIVDQNGTVADKSLQINSDKAVAQAPATSGTKKNGATWLVPVIVITLLLASGLLLWLLRRTRSVKSAAVPTPVTPQVEPETLDPNEKYTSQN